MSDSVQAVPRLVQARPTLRRGSAIWPTRRELVLHSFLFLITIITTIVAGIVIAEPRLDVPMALPCTLLDYLLFVPQYYSRTVATLLSFAFLHPHVIRDGVIFSATLLAILTAHELGHYLACQRYGVSATLPFFIPAPPLFLAGTFGAFIKIRSSIPTRRALFDIGLAGPLAGFIVTVPIGIAGVLSLQPAPPVVGETITFNDPLLFRLVASLSGVQLSNTLTNPYYMSAWLGLLVTSLNLMPVGQLDGAHGTFAVFGQRMHKLIGRVAFVVMAVLAVLGYMWHGSPSGFLYAVLLAVMVKVRHPAPQQMEPVGRARIMIAILTLIVFVLSFHPFPLTIS